MASKTHCDCFNIFKVRYYTIPTDPINESSISYAVFPPKDGKDALFNSTMSCYLWMMATGKSLLGAGANSC